jgi:hypothetical protein
MISGPIARGLRSRACWRRWVGAEIQGEFVFEFVGVGQQGAHKLLQQLRAGAFGVFGLVFGGEETVSLLGQDFLG